MTNFPSEHEWIEKFFSVPNTLIWSDLSSGKIVDKLGEEVQGWLQFLVDVKNVPLVLLPKITSKQTIWYACSHNDRQAAQVAEEVSAMVSHAYADVEHPLKMNISDPCEAILKDRFGSSICRITVHSGREDDVIRVLGTYRQLIAKRPVRPRIGVHPPGKIRGLFDRALLARNFDEANKCIFDLQSSGRLDLQNQRFLKIRLLAVQEKWEVIVGDPTYLRSLVDLALPSRILADLVEAVYQRFLKDYEDAGDPRGAVAAFREKILPKYGRLFRARKGLRTPSVLKTFLLDQLCRKHPEVGACQKLIDEYPVGHPGFEYVQALLEMIPQKPVEKKITERAKEAFDDDKVELALELYTSCLPEQDILAKVLRCSRDVEALTDLQVAWEYCQQCSEEWIYDLSAKQLKDFNVLRETFAEQRIDNWLDWVRFILDGGDKKKAEKLLQSGAMEWSMDDFLEEPDGVERFCDLLSTGVKEAPDFFQQQFAHIYEFAINDSIINVKLRPLYRTLLEFLVCAETVSESDLTLSQELVQSLFDVGVSSDQYDEILVGVELLWSVKRSFKSLNWALDMAEILAIYPSPKPELRSGFFNSLLGLVATNPQRVDSSTWMVLELLAQDYGEIECFEKLKPLAKEDAEEPEASLSGKKVGIYSLTEQAAIRAKQLLDKLFPGVVVEVNHDHAATPALENLARSSDLFVFAWRSSKHQAYYCVKKIVQEDRLLLPLGKGSSSIVNCVLEKMFTFS